MPFLKLLVQKYGSLKISLASIGCLIIMKKIKNPQSVIFIGLGIFIHERIAS